MSNVRVQLMPQWESSLQILIVLIGMHCELLIRESHFTIFDPVSN